MVTYHRHAVVWQSQQPSPHALRDIIIKGVLRDPLSRPEETIHRGGGGALPARGTPFKPSAYFTSKTRLLLRNYRKIFQPESRRIRGKSPFLSHKFLKQFSFFERKPRFSLKQNFPIDLPPKFSQSRLPASESPRKGDSSSKAQRGCHFPIDLPLAFPYFHHVRLARPPFAVGPLYSQK